MNEQQIISALESILFVAGDAMETGAIAAALEIEPEALSELADRLIEQRAQEGAGVIVRRVGSSKLQLCSNASNAPFVEKVLSPIKKSRLSSSMVETLAIIAYKQPITRFEIEQIRGVKSNYSVAALIEKGLIMRAGRKKTLGNPMLYATTDEFLRHFGIESINALPPLKQAE